MSFALPDRTYQYSFARPTRKAGRKSKSRRVFVPTDMQVETAARRIRGYLEAQGMMIEVPEGVEIDTVARKMAGKLHNRGDCLGRHCDGEVAITTLAAMRQMLNQGDAALCDGYFALTGPPRGRRRPQKYAKYSGGSQMRRRAA